MTLACAFMCRLAQATYKTPSTEATVLEESSPDAVSFCFASPAAHPPSPLATFLHQLSHATYESQGSAAESVPDAEAEFHSPEAQTCATPFQDFMKYLTQATYHSPGAKADQAKPETSSGAHNTGNDRRAGVPLDLAAADKMAAGSPGGFLLVLLCPNCVA